ncbi:cytochrome c [Pseudaestuariivita atlantica]|uniref:Diacylglycerol kinase n=1 Tax=Pseudaestuariivita atlantica TaxID=1317121 RepID=A0A0L1JNT4_9RHOB|nr:cytochrome c [Pseudaestuariivita atlantica]KNG93048.1 diacylglycerol kinase [Pseudaestuariivita atlantica]
MKALFRWAVFLALVAVAVGLWITRPAARAETEFAGLEGNADAGALTFAAAGCASCHHAPGAEGEDKLVLAGGQRFPSDFGTFIAPNISPSAQGIGGWTLAEFANAVQQGVSPEGAHYYPAFPYPSYVRAADQDIADIFAYMQTLPTSDAASLAHEVGFPFSIRRAVGVWKWLYHDDDWVIDPVEGPAQRGRYLAEALGHCGECHTPRDALGGPDRDLWLAGAPNPSGKGRIPGITPKQLFWSTGDLVEYFTSGFTPDFDSAGGHMAAVIENLAQLPREDREALAAYVTALPPAGQ